MATAGSGDERAGSVSVGGALARDAGPLVLTRLVGAAANFAVLLLLIQRMPKEDVGLYYFLVNLWNILNVFVDFGGDPIATREIARAPEREGGIFRDFLRAKAMLAGLGLVLFAVTVVALVDEPDRRWSCLLTAVVLPGFYLGSFSVLFRVRHAMRWPALALALGHTVFFAGSLAGLLALESSATRFRALTLSFGAGTLLGGTLIYLMGRGRLPAAHGARGAARFLAECWPQGVAALAGILYFYIDTLMLKAMAGDAEAGYYNAAYRLLNFFIYAAGVISMSVMPVLARERRRDPVRFARVYRDTLTLLWLMAAPAAAAGLALAHELMTFLYGDRMATYQVAVPTLRILLGAGVCTFGGALASTTLIAARRQRSWTVVALLGLGLNVALNLWAIPRFGHRGAAWATLATEAAVLVLCLALVRRGLGVGPDFGPFLRILVLSAAVFETGVLLAALPFPVAAAGCFGVWIGGAALLRVFPKRLFRMALLRESEPGPDKTA
jgi:O-antigen/teichoic acid export membrane protein